MNTDTPEIQAIPTTYRGIQFRSRAEANVAAFLDQLRLNWDYEPESFLLPCGIHYRPDFRILSRTGILWPCADPSIVWLEVRGYKSVNGEGQLRGFWEFLMESDSPSELVILHPDRSTAESIDYEAECRVKSWGGKSGYMPQGTDEATVFVSTCCVCGRARLSSFRSSSKCWDCDSVAVDFRIENISWETGRGLMVGKSPMEQWRPRI